jgi:hypothetical protein
LLEHANGPAAPITSSDRAQSDSHQRRPNALNTTSGSRRWSLHEQHFWTAVLVVVLFVVAVALGAFDWSTELTVRRADGSTWAIPNTFASGDHPFHIAREQATLGALQDGWLPYWFFNHMAGYPAEFYPTGGSAAVALLSLVTFGHIPLEIAHKLLVIATLGIVPVCYLAIARRDQMPGSIAILASLLHLLVPGNWLAGGPYELITSGIWPNVLAHSLTLVVLIAGADYLRRGTSRGLVIAAVVAAFALYTNPRSMVGVAVALSAVMIVIALDRLARHGSIEGQSSWQWRPSHQSESTAQANVGVIARRGGIVGLATLLLASSMLVPLLTHQQLYHFAHYNQFSDFGHIFTIYREAVPTEIIALACVGLVMTTRTRHFHLRVLAVTYVLSITALVLLGWFLRDLSIFAQLEGPRMIPLLRPATMFLAAFAIHELAFWLIRQVNAPVSTRVAATISLAAAAISLLTPLSPLDDNQRGLPPHTTTSDHRFVSIVRAADVVMRHSDLSDRLMIVGNPGDVHSSFWIPTLSGRTAFHDDWIWYWREPAFADRTLLRDRSDAIRLSFLVQHGLTFVLIDQSDDVFLNQALMQEHLTMVDPGAKGGYAVFRVVDQLSGAGPAGWVTFDGGAVDNVSISRTDLGARGSTSDNGIALIRVNHHPAWRATVNGVPAAIRPTVDGYMEVNIPGGDTVVELRYEVTRSTWIGRGLIVIGVLLLAAVTIIERRRRGPQGDAESTRAQISDAR